MSLYYLNVNNCNPIKGPLTKLQKKTMQFLTGHCNIRSVKRRTPKSLAFQVNRNPSIFFSIVICISVNSPFVIYDLISRKKRWTYLFYRLFVMSYQYDHLHVAQFQYDENVLGHLSHSRDLMQGYRPRNVICYSNNKQRIPV